MTRAHTAEQIRQLQENIRQVHALHRAAARRSSAAFASYVMRDEKGQPLKLASFHHEWHRLWHRHKQLILWGSAEIGKTVQIISYVAWRIGIDPSTRCVIVSKTKEKAAQILGAIVNVMCSKLYQEVFPGTIILSSNAHTLRVVGYDGKNPTVQAFQFRAPIVGNRVDLLVFDDILDRSNTRTEAMRDEYFKYYKDTFVSRLTQRGQVIFISNAWHPRDLMHRLQEEVGWEVRKYPIWTQNEAGEMVSLWPEQWPISRIQEVKQRYGKDKVFWDRNYECVAIDDASVTWKREWIEMAERLGFGLPWPHRLQDAIGETFRTISIGVDLATKRPHGRSKTDESVLAVVGQHHNGRKRLFAVRSGRWHGPDIVREIRAMRDRFHPATVWVESNAAQVYIVDYCKEPQLPQRVDWIGMSGMDDVLPNPSTTDPIPVRAFNTTAQNKYDPRFGVEALGTELACGIWLFPNTHGIEQPAEYLKLVDEMMAYDPTGHVGDRLMALWIASEGLRLGPFHSESKSDANGRRR